MLGCTWCQNCVSTFPEKLKILTNCLDTLILLVSSISIIIVLNLTPYFKNHSSLQNKNSINKICYDNSNFIKLWNIAKLIFREFKVLVTFIKTLNLFDFSNYDYFKTIYFKYLTFIFKILKTSILLLNPNYN